MSGKLPNMGTSKMSLAIIKLMVNKPIPITQNGNSFPIINWL